MHELFRWGLKEMTGSLFLKIVIGSVIFFGVAAYQVGRIKRLAPGLEDFIQTANISGVYTYERYGRNIFTKVGDSIIHCDVDYGGGNGSCFIPLRGVSGGSYINVAAASIKTSSGIVLYAVSIMADGRVVYGKSPRQALHGWWFGSWSEVVTNSLLWLNIYISFLILYVKMRRKDNA